MYDLIAVDWQTGARLGQVRYATLEWHEVVTGAGDWSCTIEGHDPSVGLLLPGCTLVYVHDVDTRTILYAGIVWRVTRHSSYMADVSGSSLVSYFARRVIRTTQTWTNTEQLAIAEALVTAMQAIGGGTLRLSIVRKPTNSGVTRTVTYAASELVTYADALDKLAQLDGGFEYGIRAAWAGGSTITHTLTLGYPTIGADLPLVWAEGVDVMIDQTEDDRTDYATWWRARGGGADVSAPTVDIGPSTQPVTPRSFPVLETAQTYSEVTTTALLTARGTADQRASHVETMNLGLVAARPRWPPGSWHVGDSVRIVCPPPCPVGLDGATWWRIGGYTASIDEDGQLVVTLDVDRARNNSRPVLRPIDRLAGVRADTQRRLAVVENLKS